LDHEVAVEEDGAGEGAAERGDDGRAEREVGDEVAWDSKGGAGMIRGLGFGMVWGWRFGMIWGWRFGMIWGWGFGMFKG
jgi:hypothetical protein